jgi:hypothetical protein
LGPACLPANLEHEADRVLTERHERGDTRPQKGQLISLFGLPYRIPCRTRGRAVEPPRV